MFILKIFYLFSLLFYTGAVFANPLHISYEFDEKEQEIIAVLAFTEPDLPLKEKEVLIEMGLGYLFPAGLNFETKATLLKFATQRQMLAAKIQINSNLRLLTAPTHSLGLALHYPVTKNWSIGPIYKLWLHKNSLLDPDYTMYLSGAGIDSDLSLKPFKKKDFKISFQGQVSLSDLGGVNLLAFHGGIILKIPIYKK